MVTDNKVLKVGFIGSGDIAHRVSKALAHLDEIELYAVTSKNVNHARALAEEFGFRNVYDSVEELLSDPAVDLVYVGVPNTMHYPIAKLCARYNKPALVEKPFTINRFQAEELIRIFREKDLFLGEAFWTRFLPGRTFINQTIEDGTIGDVRLVDANVICDNCRRHRMQDPALGGGALLDLGVYALNFIRMFLGTEEDKVQSTVSMWPTGVDEQETVVLNYPQGRLGICKVSMNGAGSVDCLIFGAKGNIQITGVFDLRSITVRDASGTVVGSYSEKPETIGYEYEFLAARKALLAGEKEFHENTLQDTVSMMDLCDRLRRSWGLVYPCEYGL